MTMSSNTQASALALACALAAPLAAHGAQPQAAPGTPPAVADTPGSTRASAPRDSVEVPLPEVVVKGQALPGARLPFTVDTLDQDQIREAAVPQAEALLNRIPGVSVNSYGLGGVASAISMRGFGNGAHGGGIGFMIDGIPLNEAMSHADGYADLNVLIPLELASARVFKGPTSALYGNFNRAGLVDFQTRKGGAYREADVAAGSFGTVDLQGAYGGAVGSGQFNGAAQVFRTDGFRPQSRFERATVAGRYAIPLTERLQVAVSGRLHRGDWDSASYLTRGQFAVDPYGKDPRVLRDGGDKSFGTGRADAYYTLSDTLRVLGFVYGTQQEFTRFFTRPTAADPAAAWTQREEAYDRSVFGTGASLNGRNLLGTVRVDWVAGAEAYRERTGYDQFNRLTARSRVGSAVVNDRTYRFDSDSVFAEAEFAVAPVLRPTIGLRYDRFSGDCRRDGAETSADPCGRMNEYSNLSPKFGVRSTVARGLDLRASWSEGFALPDGPAKYATGSQVRPNIFRQIEVGATWRSAGRLRADIAVFRLDSSNEIRTVAPGVFENFGATRREGVELSGSWFPAPRWEVTAAASAVRSEITENANAVLLGKRVAGVPRETVTLSAFYRAPQGLGYFGTLRRVGRFAVDAPNTRFADGFNLFDLGVQYVTARSTLGSYRLYATVFNLLDKRYASNQFVIGGQALVAPGAPRSLQVGAQFDF